MFTSLDRVPSGARPLLLVVVLLLSIPATASAQDSGEETQKAKKYYQRGMKAVYNENYAMAITNFKRAHAIQPSGTLLYNISIAYSRMGRPEKALEFARKALEKGGLPDDTRVKTGARSTSYRVVLAARSVIASKRRASAEKEKPTESTSKEAASSKSRKTSSKEPSSSDTESRTRTATETDGGLGTLSWIGIGTSALGAGALTGSLLVGIDLQKKLVAKRDAEDQGNFQKADRLHEEMRSRQQLGQILLYSGSAVTAIGATLVVIDLSTSGNSKRRAVRITGGAHENGGRVNLGLAF